MAYGQMETHELSRIRVSPEARRMIAHLQRDHPRLIFHVPMSCRDRSPICLAEGELRIGSSDVLIGYALDVPFYEMMKGAAVTRRDYILDVTPGMPVGFSLGAELGLRFTLGDARGARFRKSYEKSDGSAQ